MELSARVCEHTKIYRGAIIGLGFIGGADQVSGDAIGQRVANLDGTHLHAMLNHPRVELIAGSSRDSGRRERFADRTSARTCADWRKMLESEEIDIVSVATYTPYHAEETIACAERGIGAIYCEKPIASSLAEAEKMVEACEQNGSLLVINHNRRFNADHRRLQEHIVGGDLGDLVSVSIEWGAGRLGNVGTHMFDAVCMLKGRRVTAVSATLDLSIRPDCRGPQFHDPGGWGVLRLAGGTPVTFNASNHARFSPRIVVTGTSGAALVTGEITIEYWDGRTASCASKLSNLSAMDRAMSEIVATLDGKSFCYPASDAVQILEAIVACHASHRRNAAWTELPLFGSDRDIVVRSG